MRLRDHDYGQLGAYFITIGTLDRRCLFGDIVEGAMLLNDLGYDVGSVWLWQRGFYDHVIRDDRDLSRIREYIDTNPARWSVDAENPERAPVAAP